MTIKSLTFLESLAADPATALIVVDQQIDFQPGGALAVSGGDEIISNIAALMRRFFTVVVTQDSHPHGHISFASSYVGKKPFELLTLEDISTGRIESSHPREIVAHYLNSVGTRSQVLWPDHCITGTPGWELDSRLPLEYATLILRKGTRKTCDSYSAFFENDGVTTGLTGFLKARGIGRVVLCGLAGDYCVCWSALDAKKEGFDVVYDVELTRFVEFPVGSRAQALVDLENAGVHLV